jgi:biopolymer transport protein TolR
MAMTGGDRGGIKSEINVTPLVDVCLVLLIIFMVVTPLLQRGKAVTLPKSHSVDKEHAGGDPLILSVTGDKQIYIEKDHYTEETLEARLRDEVIADPNRPILLKGDQALNVGEVRKVLAISRRAGIRGVRLGVEQEKEPGEG